MTTDEKIDFVLGHINKVQQNCYKVGKKLIKSGEIELGRNLIAINRCLSNKTFEEKVKILNESWYNEEFLKEKIWKNF